MAPGDQSAEGDDFGDDDGGPDDLSEGSATLSMMAEEPAAPEHEPFQPPDSDTPSVLPTEEPPLAALAESDHSSDHSSDHASTSSTNASAAEPLVPAEHPDRLTPEQS
jgi:hypothetical protein